MEYTLTLPENLTFTKVAGKPHTKTLVVEPCFPGYGTTLGNALRRVLFSSLRGAAVIAVKIKGVTHEFTTIPYVQEDVLDIILNLKNLRFKVHNPSQEPIKLTLTASGEKEVTAKDIMATSDVEVVGKEVTICHLTDKAATLEMELFVQEGMGYSPTEARGKEKLELGTIAIDAIFTPVVNVSFTVENVRVGEYTNYEKLVMEIATDGTVTPEDAVNKAASILIDHYKLFTAEGQKQLREAIEEKARAEEAAKKEAKERGQPSDVLGEKT